MFTTIKEYIKNPKYIIYDLQNMFGKLKRNCINRMYKKLHEYEFEYISMYLKDDYCKRNEGQGILSPLVTVYKVLERHFGFDCVFRMKIHEIVVDTQNKDGEINVNIKLARPSLLIGKAGYDIDCVEDDLRVLFGRQVIINIIEMRNDVNEPLRICDESWFI